MQRRDFLTLGTAGLGTALVAPGLITQCSRRNPMGRNAQSIAAQGSKPTIAPERYQSQNGQMDLMLEARSGTVVIGRGSSNLLTYNGRIPGPRIEANPGDRIRLTFRNSLATPTNLHFHGLHIPPSRPGDNPFLRLNPGEQTIYEFALPQDHPSTTAYYHPHLHGYVAEQIFGGLGGIFIIRGELDKIPEIQAAQEEFIFLKDFELEQPNDARSNHMGTMGRMGGMMMLGREGNIITVNGQIQPRITVTKGLLRLRLINASTSRFYRLSLEQHPLYLIATDGGAIEKPQEVIELLLAPGERAEVLIQPSQAAGSYRLLNLPYKRAAMGMGQGMMKRGNFADRRQTPEVLATIAYSEAIKAQPLPSQLIAVEQLGQPVQKRRFTLNHGMAPGQGMVFLINGKPFDHDRIDTTVKLGTIEDWEIVNTGVMDHPFHLHTNRFQIIQRNGQAIADRQWKDTVLIPVGESATIRIPFQKFPGKTVYHCHILDHEDLGMMGVIEMQA